MPNAIPKLNEPIGVFKSPSFLLVVTPFLPKKASVSNIFLSSSKYSKIAFLPPFGYVLAYHLFLQIYFMYFI